MIQKKNLKIVLIITCLVSSMIIPLSVGFIHYLKPIEFSIPLYDGYSDGLILYNPFKCLLKISISCRKGNLDVFIIQGSNTKNITIPCGSSKIIDVDSGTTFIIFRVKIVGKYYLLGESIWITIERVIK